MLRRILRLFLGSAGKVLSSTSDPCNQAQTWSGVAHVPYISHL